MSQDRYPDDVLLTFIGYACDARGEVKALTGLKKVLQEYLNQLNQVSPSRHHRIFDFFSWDEDADRCVGGQKKSVDQYIKRADIAIFIFRTRVGGVTWEELNEIRDNPQKSIPILVFFPESIPPGLDMNRKNVIKDWYDLLKKKSSLTGDWSDDKSRSIPPIQYKNVAHLEEIALKELQRIISTIESSNRNKHTPELYPSHIKDKRQFIDKLTGKIDYDPSLIRYFRSRLRRNLHSETEKLDDVEFLEKEGFIREGNLTIAGAFLFTNTPCTIIPTARIKCVRYFGDEKSKARNRHEFKDSLLKQIERSYEFIELNIEKKEKPVGDGLRSRTIYKFPMVTVREIIANAVSHRDYTDGERQIHVRVFDNSIEVVSPGNWFQRALTENQLIRISELCSESVKTKCVACRCVYIH